MRLQLDQLTLIILCIVGLAVSVACGWAYVYRPLMARKVKEQARELEVQIRMGSGMSVVEDLRKLSNLYMSAGDIWNADKYLERAVKVAEGQLGSANPEMLPLLNEYLKLLERMRRKKEAKKLKERIKQILPRTT